MACIELIGCTGAGKSTLINAILRLYRKEGIDAWLDEDFVLKQVRIDGLKNEAVRAVLVNFIALFVALIAWQKYSEFFKFAIRFISQLPISIKRSERLYIGKNIFKNIGIYEIVRRRVSPQQIVLLDEGPLHTAQILFVRLAIEPQGIDLSTFVSLVPLPDIVIYLQRNEEILIERTLTRRHKRIPSGSRTLAKSFIKGSVATFDKLIQYPMVEQMLLIVDNNQNITVPRAGLNCPSQQLVLKILKTGLDIVNEYLNIPQVSSRH